MSNFVTPLNKHESDLETKLALKQKWSLIQGLKLSASRRSAKYACDFQYGMHTIAVMPLVCVTLRHAR